MWFVVVLEDVVFGAADGRANRHCGEDVS